MVFKNGISKTEHDQVLAENRRLQILNEDLKYKISKLENESQDLRLKAGEVPPLKYRMEQLKEQISSQSRTIEGLKQAVRKWRRKAGQDQELPQEFLLVKTEYRETSGYYETWLIPDVVTEPTLIKEAINRVKESDLIKNSSRLVSIFNDSRGWLVVLHIADYR